MNEMDSILVVDDNVMITTNLCKLFRKAGWTTGSANDVESAFLEAKELQPDVVLLDLRVPRECDGLEAIEPILERSPDTCLIVFTGYGSVPATVEAMHLGAWNFIEKRNDDFGNLLDLVSISLERKRERDKLAKLAAYEREQRARIKSTLNLSNGIAHDFKNRLADCGYAVSLALALDPPQEVSSRVKEVQAALRKLNESVDELRRLADVQRLEIEQVALGQVLELAVATIARRRELQGLTRLHVSLQLASSQITVQSSHDLLVKSFENILDNSSEAVGAKNGEISVKVIEQEDQVLVRFSDTGSGFDRAVLDRADLPFETTKGKANYGVGLAFVKEVIERSGGRLRYGNNTDRGAWVEACLPAWSSAEHIQSTIPLGAKQS
ncbi:MAG: response regulator [Planctomycetota bacterium]